MATQIEIAEDKVKHLITVIDQGLTAGKGNPEPGRMCVEAAVCYALGLPHGDDPGCVAESLRYLQIRLNDSGWSSNEARSKGLRRLAVAQLGSKDNLDEKEFVRRVVDLVICKYVPISLRAAASVLTDEKHKAALCKAANRCEREGTLEAALEAKSAAYAYADPDYAYAAAASEARGKRKAVRDKYLAGFAEDVVQILIDMKALGCQWLPLTEAA